VTAPASPELSETEQWRRRYRQQRARRSGVVASISTVIFVAALWLAIVHTPGWPQAHQAFFNGHEFRVSLPLVARGILVNLKILVIGEPCILILGLVIALLRTTTGAVLTPLRIAGTAYVDFFRGCPLIILLYLFALGIPSLRLGWLPNSGTIWGAVAIILCYASYVAEVFRAGIQSVHPSQRAAARSLGLSQRQSLRIVVLPQAVRSVLPPLLNDFVALQKDVGLISIVATTTDAIQAAAEQSISDFTFTPYVVAALFFIVLAVPTGRIADTIGARANTRQRAGAIV
jgi:polar amino acid transport system permease protein